MMGHVRMQGISTTSRWVAIVSLVVCGSLVACGGAPKQRRSGFLGDYSKLKPAEKYEGAYIWESPKLDQYQWKYMVDHVIVHFAPAAEGIGVDPEMLEELTTEFTQKVKEVVAKRRTVVSKPGPGVARIRIAITDIKTTTPVANIHPGMALTGMGLGGASVEGEVVDSLTGERLAAIYDSKAGSRVGTTAGLKKYGHAKQVMARWAEQFGKYLDELAKARAQRKGK